jgi:hypothetical protein
MKNNEEAASGQEKVSLKKFFPRFDILTSNHATFEMVGLFGYYSGLLQHAESFVAGKFCEQR